MLISRGRVLVLPLALTACTAAEPDTSTSPQESPRFEELRIPTPDGLRLYARVLGTGPDTVIIGPAAYLAQDLARLAPGRTLIFYDPRNRGGSDVIKSPERVGMAMEVADIEAVRAHFGIQQFALIGWSYLGAVAALYAAKYPDHVRAAVQIGPMAPRGPVTQVTSETRGTPPDSADLAYLEELRERGVQQQDPVGYCREALLRQLLRPMMGRPEAAARSRMDPCIYWNEWAAQVFPTIQAVIPQAMGVAWDYTDQAARVKAPVLTIHGASDPNAPIEGGRDWIVLLPNAQLVEIEGVGHAPWLEAPDQFFTIVDAFLKRH